MPTCPIDLFSYLSKKVVEKSSPPSKINHTYVDLP